MNPATNDVGISTSKHFFWECGELGKEIEEIDWSTTSLGALETWSHSLKVALSLCLKSCVPMILAWGEELILFYNTPWRTIFESTEHPLTWGKSARQLPPDIWNSIASQLETVLTTGEATQSDHLLFYTQRNHHQAASYYTYTWMPILLETGEVGGGLGTVTETTQQVIHERRLKTLNALSRSKRLTQPNTKSQVNSGNSEEYQQIIEAIKSNPADIPFALLYHWEAQEKTARLVAHTLSNQEISDLHQFIDLNRSSSPITGLLNQVLKHEKGLVIENLQFYIKDIFPVKKGILLPILATDKNQIEGILIAGINPDQTWDENYRQFLELVAQMAWAIASTAQNLIIQEQRQESKTALQQQEEEIRLITDSLPALVAYVDDQQRYRFNNRGYEEWFGAEKKAFLGKKLWDVLGQEAYQAIRPYIERVLHGEQVSYEKQIPYKDGGTRYINATYVPHQDADGKVVGFVALVQDITSEKQTLEALHQSEILYQTLADAMPQLVWTITPDGQIGYVNQQWQDALGVTAEQVNQGGWGLIIHPDDLEPLLNRWQTIVEEEQSRDAEFRYRMADGSYRWFLGRSRPLRNERGELMMWVGTSTDITERKHAEEAQRQSEERLRVALKDSPITMFHQDLDLRYTWIYNNPKARFDDQEMIGKQDAEILPLEQAQMLKRLKRQVIETEVGVREEVKLFMRGQDCYYDLTLEPLRNRQQQVIGITGAAVDITSRKQAEQALKESEERFRLMADSAPMLLWMSGTDQHCNFFNQGWLTFTGRTMEEELGLGWIEGIHPDDRDMCQQTYVQGFEHRRSFLMEYRLRRADGQYRWVLDIGKPRYSPDGVFMGYIGSCVDITDRRIAEEALRESEERFRQIAETIQDVFWMCNPATFQLLYVSPAYQKIWGRSSTNLYENSQDWLEAVHPEDQERVQIAFLKCASGEQRYDEEYRVIRPDGSLRWVRDRAFLIENAAGQVYRMAGIAEDITDRKHVQEELKRSETRFRRLAEANMFGVAICDYSGNFLYTNDAFLQMIGYSREEVLSGQLTWMDITPAEYLPLDEKAGEELRERGVINPFQKEYIHKNGHRIPVLLGAALLDESDVEQQQIICFYLDLSDLKQTEKALQDALQKLNFHVENTPLAVIEWNPQKQVKRWSSSAERIFGWRAEEVLGKHCDQWFFVYTEDQESVNQIWKRIFEDREAQTINSNRNYTKTGEIRFCEWYNSTLVDEQGQVTSVLSLVQDVTERELAQTKQREDNERLTLALDAAKMGSWDWNLQTGEILWSPYHEMILGYEPGQPHRSYSEWVERVHPEDLPNVLQIIEETMTNRTEYESEYRVMWPDGSVHWVYALGRYYYNSAGEAIRMVGMVSDISDRKATEEALRISRERLDLVLEAAQLGLWYCDLPFSHLNWNARCKAHFGLPPEADVTIDLFYQCLHPEDRERTRLAIERSLQNRTHYDIDYRTLSPEGQMRWLRAIGRGFYTANGQPYRFDGITIDITERKHAEEERERLLEQEQIARAEAEAANRIKDEFLAVLSHELRTPLNPILGWSKLLRSRNFDPKTTQRALETIERNAKLQTQLIEDLLDVSRILRGKMVLNQAPVDLALIIEAALETVQLAAQAKDISIQTDLDCSGHRVLGDASRLQQIVWNLLSNAVKFTPSGGSIEINLKQVENFALISIKDTGIGITPEFLPHIFEYFRQADSTTTRKFGGLGLGLAIVRHLTELHGGSVWAESAGMGQGSTFTTQLPLMMLDGESQVLQPPLRDWGNLLKGLKVLMVDDGADIRELVAMILMPYEIEVQLAASGAEALAVLERFQPDLLIADIGMPEMDGYTLLQQIRQRPPEQCSQIPAIALTAYAGETNQQQALKAGFQIHLSKPTDPDALIEAIARLVRAC